MTALGGHVVNVSMLALAKIRLDGGTQPRESLCDETIREYAEAMRAKIEFPPVVVFYDGTHYWLADGFHRVHAAMGLDLVKIAAEIRQGTQRDAILYSCGVNAAHGLRRTNADKRRAVMKLLADPEWSKWSDREIARRCAVGHPLVATLRRELSGSSSRYEFRSVDLIRAEVSGQNSQIERPARQVMRRGTTYMQKPRLAPATSGGGQRSQVHNGGHPTEQPKETRSVSHFDQALEEARAWMVRWAHLSALSPVFEAITMLLETRKGVRT